MKCKILLLIAIVLIAVFITTGCEKNSDVENEGYDYFVLVNKLNFF